MNSEGRKGVALILVLLLIGLFVFGYFSNQSKLETGVSLWVKIGIPDTFGQPSEKKDVEEDNNTVPFSIDKLLGLDNTDK